MLKSEVSNDQTFFVPSCFLIIVLAHPMGKEELLREVVTLVTLVINVHELSMLLLVKDACGSLESPWLFSVSFVDSQV